jgi:hypothetical protein
MNWHQQAAARRAYRLRKLSAHILADDYIRTGCSLCGRTNQPVTVGREHAHNPLNRTCKKCLAALDKTQ